MANSVWNGENLNGDVEGRGEGLDVSNNIHEAADNLRKRSFEKRTKLRRRRKKQTENLFPTSIPVQVSWK